MSNNYFECPECGWILSFHYNDERKLYYAVCPYCENSLEVEKDEFENDKEKYFEFE